MADDASYNTFLTKANADPKSGGAPHAVESTSQARSTFDPTTPSDAIPVPLRNLPATTYTSDTDSDFEPVFFSYASDSLPSVDQFKHILSKKGYSGEVEELSVKDFDPRSQYTEIIERVRQVGGAETRGKDTAEGGVKIFRVQKDKTRVEYYILTVGERKLVGVVAKAVES